MQVTVNRIIRKVNQVDGKITVDKPEIRPLPLQIVTSYKAHLKWEEQFQLIKKQDLSTYTSIVSQGLQKWKENQAESTYVTDALRVLYCYIDSPELPTFSEFVGILEPENTLDIINILSTVLSEVGKTASKN